MLRNVFTFAFSLIAFCLLTSDAKADLGLPNVFSDNMILQRDKPIVVWGWTEKSKDVVVKVGQSTAQTKSDGEGNWKVTLPAMPVVKEAISIVVESDDDRKEIKNVLVGEVWFASGQSNMAFLLRNSHEAKLDMSTAKYPNIRMFLAANVAAKTPQRNVGGKWNVCTPESCGSFSAAAYFFARRIHEETGVPVGVIKSCIGGKRAECYCSAEAMNSNSHGKIMMEQLAKQSAAYDAVKAKAKHEKALAAWEERAANVKEANRGKEKKDRKRLPRKPKAPTHPMLNQGNPTVLYNGMIHPFVGYSMRGAIWYQGEANARANLAPIYKEMFTLMIQDWRTRWNDDFAFYFVQLADFKKETLEPGATSDWATVQNQQRLTLELANTGMATINDIGNATDIHPKNKRDVGERLARWALKNQYNKDVVVSGPLFKSASFEGGEATVVFDHVGEGLKSRDDKPLKRFEIAGADKKWHWGTAKIVDNHVVVTSPEVSNPVAVRYAWAANPVGANLVNSEGLPTSIFRTDDW